MLLVNTMGLNANSTRTAVNGNFDRYILYSLLRVGRFLGLRIVH